MATPPDFSVGQVLTAAHMNAVGLWLVKTQTVGSAVSSVTVSNCFSADYLNYRVIISGIDNVTADNGIKLTLSGSTGLTYSSVLSWRDYATGATSGTNYNNSDVGWIVALTGANDDLLVTLDISQPFATKYTSGTWSNAATNYYAWGGGVDKNSTSHTGFTISAFTAGNNFTGGTIRVYGYRN